MNGILNAAMNVISYLFQSSSTFYSGDDIVSLCTVHRVVNVTAGSLLYVRARYSMLAKVPLASSPLLDIYEYTTRRRKLHRDLQNTLESR
jgi:hypothetical protein